MNTFLPYRSFDDCSKCLDNKRLGKQRVEVLQILKTLNGQSKGWRSHPAVLMWKHYEPSLIAYGTAICLEWLNKGFKDNCLKQITEYYQIFGDEIFVPDWLTDEFIKSHRSNLLRKNPEYYNKFNWQVSNDLPYIWPVKAKVDI